MTAPVVIVSGASRGLGESVARRLTDMGASVVITARSAERLHRLADEIQSAGGSALVIPGDLSLVDISKRIVRGTLERFGRIDALVNNAGVLEPLGAFADITPTDWEYNLAVNLNGAVNLTHTALPHLRKAGGRVVHISSGAAINPIPGASVYSIAKAALNHLNKVLALEEPEICSIALRPGVIDTEMQAVIRRDGMEGMPAQRYEYFLNLHVQRKLLPPDLPGRAVALLALYAPHEWSGEFIHWDDERITSLS
jgi:NAD(P)-dependent dehydrogenase (short-subunit alcohol dehydrogenase family)